jgi:hypothetical protein
VANIAGRIEEQHEMIRRLESAVWGYDLCGWLYWVSG